MSSYGQPPTPGPWPRRAVLLAVRLLPAGPARDRYRHELLAELYGMSSIQQLRHAGSVLTHCLALRSAIDTEHQPAPSEVSMPALPPRTRILCRTGLHHAWQPRRTDDGRLYEQCSNCGKDKFQDELPTGGTPNIVVGTGI
jgi:hypothetical protein